MRFWSLRGYIPYQKARELQLELVRLRAERKIPDTILFLEHEPVITRGKGLQWTGVSRPRHVELEQPLPASLACVESERGGDLTYHGPGQWVVYPICLLDGQGFAPNKDIGAWIRTLEALVMGLLSRYGLSSQTREGATGVWVASSQGKAEADTKGEGPLSAESASPFIPKVAPLKKIASLGIAVRRWVSFHGIALNVVNDLDPFFLISPCGFSPEVMTRLGDWVELDSRVQPKYSALAGSKDLLRQSPLFHDSSEPLTPESSEHRWQLSPWRAELEQRCIKQFEQMRLGTVSLDAIPSQEDVSRSPSGLPQSIEYLTLAEAWDQLSAWLPSRLADEGVPSGWSHSSGTLPASN